MQNLKNLGYLAESYGEPKKNLGDRDKADAQAKSTDSAKAGDEVQPGHL